MQEKIWTKSSKDTLGLKEYFKSNLVAYNKEDFKNYMFRTKKPIFRHQQAGAKGGNDDYICVKFDEFTKLSFIKEIDLW